MAKYTLDEVKVAGVDVTIYRVDWIHDEEWKGAIDVATVVLSKSVTDVVTPEVGDIVTIKRGFASATEEFVFDGQVTQEIPQVNIITLECKGQLIDAIKASQTKSYDKDIDIEGGVGSEIFKDLCDDAGLSYTPAKETLTNGSIINTGSLEPTLIKKFIQNDEDNFQKMNELAGRYNYIIRRNPSDGYVYFQPKGYIVYPVSLEVGFDIPGQIRWKNNMEQLCNKVIINGATVYDKINPSIFSGPATEFTLLKTPEDTEVRQTSATGTLFVRGQKGIGVLGTDYDYYVDEDQKKIIFGSAKSNVWLRYGAQVPMPVTLKNSTSVNTYGGPNKKPHKKKFTFPDLKDINDAEEKGREILNKYSTPFIEAENVPVLDDVIQINGVVEPGSLINIIDGYTSKNLDLFVKKVRKQWSSPNDEITIGDELWRTEDWQATQTEKINLLFNELNKNQDILISSFDSIRDIKYGRRYAYLETKDRSGDGVNTFILGHNTFGVLGTQELGEAGLASWETVTLLQGKNTYEEFIYDEVFIDGPNTTATVNTTTKVITF